MKKKISVFFALVFVFVLLPVWATAATVEGTIQGFNCVIHGTVCPTGKEDPLVATEPVLVLLTAGKDYYFIPNVNRSVLARHVNQKVRVNGKMNSKHNSIMARTIEVMEKGSWKTTWSLVEERKMYEEQTGRWY